MKKEKSYKNKYSKIEELGKGGNAQVWIVEDKNNVQYALKKLKRFNGKKFRVRKSRFKNEIEVMQKNSKKIEGIMPVLDFSKKELWYTMPIATPIFEYIEEQNFDVYKTIDVFIHLSKTLTELHERGISHRDIKPDNIYYYNSKFCFGDFGLVEIPDSKDDLTKDERKLGPTFTIAPEMKRDPEHADGKKADVYSLAKTLWILLTGDKTCFEGTYNFLDNTHSLRNYEKFKTIHLVELEELLTKATDNNPTLRPDADTFNKSLINWKEISQDEEKSQYSSWNFIDKYLFGANVPRSAVWDKPEEIVSVLNLIISSQSYSHLLFSSQGGNDFLRAEKANEDGFIYIYDILNEPSLLKPKALHYERFADHPEWSYFLLEIAEVNPIIAETKYGYEPLVEDAPAHYVSAKYYQYGVYDYDSGEKLPADSKRVYRYFTGKFLFVLKYGPYNHISSSYDGRHGNLSCEQFRAYILQLINLVEKYIALGINKKLILKSIRTKQNINDTEKERYKKEFEREEEIKKLISDNYLKWNFKEILISNNQDSNGIRFFYSFDMGAFSKESFDAIIENKYVVLCEDGFFKYNPDKKEIYYLNNREQVLELRDKLYKCIVENFCGLDYDAFAKNIFGIRIHFTRNGSPEHLFTKDEILNVLRNGDDRVSNTLVIDEGGYARLIQGNSEVAHTYPVAFESWDAGNVYVGKYADLSDVDNYYLNALRCWKNYLENDEYGCVNVFFDNLDEQVLLDSIQKFYK